MRTRFNSVPHAVSIPLSFGKDGSILDGYAGARTTLAAERSSRTWQLRLALPPVFGPSSLCGSPQKLTSLFGADIAPARSAQADRRSMDRFWRQFPARNVEELEGEIEQDLGRKTRVTHDAAKPGGPA